MRVVRAAVPGAPARAGEARTPLAEALPLADFVSLHCPLTASTRGLVGAGFLAAMKPGAILINTGRGALIDDAALAAALTSGHLGGAGLDVLAAEPPPPAHPLTDPRAPWAGRVVVTPHIGWGTVGGRGAGSSPRSRATWRPFCRARTRNRVALSRARRRSAPVACLSRRSPASTRPAA